MGEEPLLLGIDIGTSKVAAAIVGPDGVCRESRSMVHGADSACAPGRAEQDPRVLLDAARQVVRDLEPALRHRVEAVGVTGQMHGVVLIDGQGRPVGPLVTWQDQRCDVAFLERLHAQTGYMLRSGYGCATLAYLAHAGGLPDGATAACTIHDLLAAQLVGAARPVTEPTDAAAWGLVDLRTLRWDQPAVEAAGISPAWLPEVVPCSACIGRLTEEAAETFGLAAGIPVAAALGDNQASLLATLTDPEHDVGLTLGTGGQLSVVLPEGFMPGHQESASSFEIRPFPGGRYVAVACALCGGAAWRWLAETAQAWMSDLGVEPLPLDRVYERLNELGLTAETSLKMDTSLAGERHEPGRRGCLRGIGPEPMRLGSVARALARGVVRNLREMLPAEYFAGRQRVIASGNALRRNPLLQTAAAEVLGVPVILSPSVEEAACGAAMNARALLD